MNVSESNSPSSEFAPTKPVAKRSPRRIAIIFLIWLAVCGGLLALLISAIQAAREAARCQQCYYHLKMLCIGLQ